MALSLIALLLLAGAAYGVTSLNRTDHQAASTTPWLGAKLENWPGGGALVLSVSPASPAASAGLHAGDVIRDVQGRPVGAPIDVSEAIAALGVGDRLELQVERNSQIFGTTVVLGARPSDAP